MKRIPIKRGQACFWPIIRIIFCKLIPRPISKFHDTNNETKIFDFERKLEKNTAMISALLLLNVRGHIILSRAFRDNLDM